MFINAPRNVREFKDSPIKLTEVKFCTDYLLSSYQDTFDCYVSIVIKNNTIHYSDPLIDGDSEVDLIPCCMIPDVFNVGEGLELDKDEEWQTIKVPYFANTEFLKIYLEDSQQDQIGLPFTTKSGGEDWESISRRFDYWGQYLAYCRNAIKRQEEKERQYNLKPPVEHDDNYFDDEWGEELAV